MCTKDQSNDEDSSSKWVKYADDKARTNSRAVDKEIRSALRNTKDDLKSVSIARVALDNPRVEALLAGLLEEYRPNAELVTVVIIPVLYALLGSLLAVLITMSGSVMHWATLFTFCLVILALACIGLRVQRWYGRPYERVLQIQTIIGIERVGRREQAPQQRHRSIRRM